MVFEENLRPEAFKILVSRNLFRQHQYMLDTTSLALEHLPNVRLFGTYIRELNAIATAGLCATAGQYRNEPASINTSNHQPPHHTEIEDLIGDLCVDVSKHWGQTDPIDLAAYVIWKLTWIHPFVDGNGRTADAVGYSVLCRKLGFMLPGANPIPTYWHANRDKQYYQALASADSQMPSLPQGPEDLSDLLGRALINQLSSIP
jgi:Fic family protein